MNQEKIHPAFADYAKEEPEKFKCPAPDASNAEKESSGTGAPPSNGPSHMGVLILLLESIDLQKNLIDDLTQSLRTFPNQTKEIESLKYMMAAQRSQIDELTQAVKFLAEQVKTLVDGLAEDQDPDQPISSYLSGKPV